MVALAPILADETDRLESLRSYGILDTPADERFDLFTRLTTWLFDAPMSAINLVDADRTFFKSIEGLPTYEPQRATSICAHAVGADKPIMVVEDLSQDPRFHDHPFVEKGIRFYAGALVRSASGHALGTLCIADRQPRRLSPEDEAKLVEMAAGVGVVLELHRLSLVLREAAMQDPLTGLGNRRAFDEALKRAVAEAGPGDHFALLWLDLDRFKQVNDTFGHAEGDALLREVGRRLVGAVRAGDLIARLGGDEFVVLMIPCGTAEQADAAASTILASLDRPYRIGEESVAISASIGIAHHSRDAVDAAELMRCADRALYAAKHGGRNRSRAYGSVDADPSRAARPGRATSAAAA